MNLKQQMAIAMMAALTGVMGVVPSIPIGPVPITIQSIAPMLAGGILGAKRGAASMMLFLLLVACSVPILSGGRGGRSFIRPDRRLFIWLDTRCVSSRLLCYLR